MSYDLILVFLEEAARTPGQIEDLCDLLAEDWTSLGSVREMGIDTAKFFRVEMNRHGEVNTSRFSMMKRQANGSSGLVFYSSRSTSWSILKSDLSTLTSSPFLNHALLVFSGGVSIANLSGS